MPAAIVLLALTFFEDVLPILERHCLACHQAGEAAPMALTTFAEARPWAKAIRESVLTDAMPPGGGLPERDREVLRQWAAHPAAGPARAARLPVRPTLRADAVFAMPQALPIAARSTVDYQHFILPTHTTADRWVQAIEVRPGNRRVVHHAVVFVRTAKSEFLRGGRLSVADEVLATYLPGDGAFRLPEGMGKLLPKGAELVLQLHYTSTAHDETDRTEVRLEYAASPPRERVYTMSIAQWNFAIPPYADDYPVEAEFTVQTGVRILAVTPHMHLRGKSIRVEAGEETILDLPRYRFDWQLRRVLPRPISLARGETIRVEATFDNSRANPRNPDPAATVRWGEQSWQEMLVAFVDAVIPAGWPPEEIYRPKRF